MKATEFRRTLFQSLDQAIEGEVIVIDYKGARLRLTAEPAGSKLARLVRRNALIVDPDSIVESDSELMDSLESHWAEEDKRL
ncbi:MAG: hypothetical protein U0Q16_31035 [Bryobacteraceae bacterium]